MIRGIDTPKNLTQHISAMKAAGLRFAARYLFAQSAFKEILTSDEAKALSSSGFQIVTVWENGSPTSPGYFTSGRGHDDAIGAIHYARLAGQPTGSTIFFAVDGDVPPASVMAYFNTLAPIVMNAGYRVGVYGSGAVCSALRAKNLVTFTWLSQSSGWTGHQNWLSKAEIIQGPVTRFDGLDSDTDTIPTESSLGAVSWKVGQ